MEGVNKSHIRQPSLHPPFKTAPPTANTPLLPLPHLVADVGVLVDRLDSLALGQSGVPRRHRLDAIEQLLQQQPGQGGHSGLLSPHVTGEYIPGGNVHISCKSEDALSIHLLHLAKSNYLLLVASSARYKTFS